MASDMGLEALQISTCYKMAGCLKVFSYKMTLKIWSYLGLEASLFIVEISMGLNKGHLGMIPTGDVPVKSLRFIHNNLKEKKGNSTMKNISKKKEEEPQPTIWTWNVP